jgi:hypothetical protein
MDEKTINDIFKQNVSDNTLVRVVEKHMEFLDKVIRLIQCNFRVDNISRTRGNLHEKFGYDVHVGNNLYLRVSSMGIHLNNDAIGYRQVDEALLKDIVTYCNEKMVRTAAVISTF